MNTLTEDNHANILNKFRDKSEAVKRSHHSEDRRYNP